MNKKIFLMSQQKLYDYIIDQLKNVYGYNNIYEGEKKEYIVAEGDIPIALMAHLDTVAEQYVEHLPTIVIEDDEHILVNGGMTLDDRLGIAGIFEILNMNLRPHLIFTTDEEIGGAGAHALIRTYPRPPLNIKFIIALDRQGHREACFYDCENRAFKSYITGFGYHEKEGIFSDCLILGGAWNIASVNLSIGYRKEHSNYEYGELDSFYDTIFKVKRILYKHDDSLYYTYNT